MASVSVQPPTDKPEYPSYECKQYKAFKADLQYLKDCWNGSLNKLPSDRAQMYLPKNYCEHPEEYARRLARSHFDNQFKKTITGYAGVFSKFTMESELEDTLKDNADRCGCSFKALLDEAIQKAGRDRYCFLFPQFYKGVGEPRNKAEEMQSGKRPYLSIVEAQQVINWAIHHGTITHVTIKELHPIPSEDYAQAEETLYRVLRLNQGRIEWELLRMKQRGDSADWSVEVVDNGALVSANESPITTMPLIPVVLDDMRWWKNLPFPFMEMAQSNVLLYQVQSDRREIEYKLVPTLAVSPGPNAKCIDEQGNLTLGGFINLGTNGNAFVVEANGNGLPSLFTEEENIRASIRQQSLEFVQTAGPERKEVQVKLDLQDLQNNLERKANLIESSVQSALAVLAQYAGIQDGGSINIACDISIFLDNIQDLAIAVQSKILSRETAVKRMVQIGYSENAEEELDRILKESQMEADQLANAIAPKENEEDIEEL